MFFLLLLLTATLNVHKNFTSIYTFGQNNSNMNRLILFSFSWVLFFARSFVFVLKYLLLFLLVSVLTSTVGTLCSLCKSKNPLYLSICQNAKTNLYFSCYTCIPDIYAERQNNTTSLT